MEFSPEQIQALSEAVQLVFAMTASECLSTRNPRPLFEAGSDGELHGVLKQYFCEDAYAVEAEDIIEVLSECSGGNR